VSSGDGSRWSADQCLGQDLAEEIVRGSLPTTFAAGLAQDEGNPALTAVERGRSSRKCGFLLPAFCVNVYGMAETSKNSAAVALGRLGGLKGGKARAKKLTAEQRAESARKAAVARWSRKKS
jgi:hypothetical protein